MKIFNVFIFFLILVSLCFSVPAPDDIFTFSQPDGSTFNAYVKGDENFHYIETPDGFIVLEDLLGYYSYANQQGEASHIYVHELDLRTHNEKAFLEKLDKPSLFEKLLNKAPKIETLDYKIPDFVYRGVNAMPNPNLKITQGDVKGLIVLVQFSDVKFKSNNPQAQFNDYMNKEGYNEYYNLGSVRDYFIDNSMGKFRPSFDVVGPVTLSNTRASYGGSGSDRNYKGARSALGEAIDSLVKWGTVDFSKYDNDGDGAVDFTYMFYAGVGSNNSGVTEAIWPHAWYFGSDVNLKSGKYVGNGVYVNRYACSNEIDGYAYKKDNNTDILGGIGTFAHEFGHVLGLPDMYDLKGSNSKPTPKQWDVMDQGNYNCPYNKDNTQNCAPPYYTAFERMSLGWLNATELNNYGETILKKVDDNFAYSITNPENPDEFFLLEYRSKQGWDIAIPNSGMLIWHIDYVDSIWKNKLVNNNESHMYVDIVEAVPSTSKSSSTRDVFPGTGNVTSFSQFTFWNDSTPQISLSEIRESSDKTYALFDVDMSVSSAVEESSSSSEYSSVSSSVSSSDNTSSSSEFLDLSSSSSFDVPYSFQSTFIVQSSNKFQVNISLTNNTIYISSNTPQRKTLRLLTINGHLLLEKEIYGQFAQVNLPPNPSQLNAVLQIIQNKEMVVNKLIKLK